MSMIMQYIRIRDDELPRLRAMLVANPDDPVEVRHYRRSEHRGRASRRHTVRPPRRTL
jgi:hypothetical protein